MGFAGIARRQNTSTLYSSIIIARGVQEWRTAERIRQEVPQFQF